MNKYEVTEWCPFCESEITMQWDVKQNGYKTICPECGNRLMLCDKCQHDENDNFLDNCDYNSETDSCKYKKKN